VRYEQATLDLTLLTRPKIPGIEDVRYEQATLDLTLLTRPKIPEIEDAFIHFDRNVPKPTFKTWMDRFIGKSYKKDEGVVK